MPGHGGPGEGIERDRGYPVCRLSLETAKSRLCGYPRTTHRELIEAVVERYPTRWPLIQSSTAQRTKYWQTVLLALALADIAQGQGEGD